MTNYQRNEAKRLGISFELSCAENAEIQAKARVIRAENIRRTSIANGSTATVTERFDAHYAAGVALIAALQA